MSKDALEESNLIESLNAFENLLNLPIAEHLKPAFALKPEFYDSHICLAIEPFQDSIREQSAQLREEAASLSSVVACVATDWVGALDVPIQIPEAACLALSTYIESVSSPMAADLDFGFARKLAKLSPEDICGTGAFGQASALGASVQNMLKEMAIDGGAASNEILGITGFSGLTPIQGVSSALEDARVANSYLSDLWKSVRDYAEEFEPLSSVPSAVLPKPIRSPWHDYASSLGFAPDVDIEKLGARHGTQFTIRQIIAFEAVARTAERLLSTRDQRKISGKLGYIRWAASFGSKLLILYAGVMSILCHLLGKDLLETQKLRGERLRRLVKCLSPPPVQPLSRLPKVKPNAPNIAA